MKLTDVLAKERERADRAQCCVVHLAQEGTFYRAYEWSAWLCFRYIKQFKVQVLRRCPDAEHVAAALCSYRGVLSHGRNKRLSKTMFG